ncbi:histone-lysine N-methyltransferase SUV39H1 isoform X2 [Rhinoderma darwinii]|uniref:histone-lysine N-methyltransferase SUV39H1 isoform X2 n=1 Tax=Rhinoderma darwinii TaxID=43563 RepID=UPI003F662EEA
MAENLNAVHGCSVDCLSSESHLQVLCRIEHIRCAALGVNRKNICNFEVEYLCDYKRVQEEELYLVKWKGYPESECSWEPRHHLKCFNLIKQFHRDLERELLRRTKATGNTTSKKAIARCPRRLDSSLSHHVVLKAKQRQRLRLWEQKLNTKRAHPGLILVENEVDLEGPPKDFMYINEYKVGEGLTITQSAVGCKCQDCFTDEQGCCPGGFQNKFAYNEDGQIITSDEAERRGQIYDRQGATYLFDLDYVEDVYTVDAARYGNISHFVNHSCKPNLQVYNVFIDNQDERLPRIAFFATRTIRTGEELTFDYNMQVDPVDVESTKMDSNFGLAGLTGSPKKRIRVECKCGATRCRKYLF